MKATTTEYPKWMTSIPDLFGKLVRAIVSGIPREKVFLRPSKKTSLYIRNNKFKHEDEVHHHTPHARPIAEKQTLLKETKKAAVRH